MLPGMILSHEHRFIFLKTTKTAGSSLEMALSRYCGPDDIITPIGPSDDRKRASLGYGGPRNYQLPLSEYRLKDHCNRLIGRERRKYNKHMTAGELRAKVDRRAWDEYFKFAVVRNPFDYAVSLYFWSNRDKNPSTTHFRQWLLSRPKKLPRNRQITHIDGRCAVDFMVRYEQFEQDLGEVVRRSGLPATLHAEFRAIGAKAGVRPKQATTSEMFAGFDEGIELIHDLFSEDIAEFGYKI
jgi:hypothetical protein